jgi:hypothetical protein
LPYASVPHPLFPPPGLPRFQKTFPDVDLSERRISGHGQFWYNLHIVFVNDGRWMEVADERLGA